MSKFRFVHAGIHQHEWPQLMSSIFRILKPGNGWIQLGELNGYCFEHDIIPTDSVLPQVCFVPFSEISLVHGPLLRNVSTERNAYSVSK